jgi:hypothetical protein
MSEPESRSGGELEPPSDRRETLLSLPRVSLGIVGVVALAWGGASIYELVQAFDPEFNPKSTPAPYELRLVTVLGFLGVLASFVVGGSGLAYAKTAAQPWLGGVAVGVSCAVPLFVVWFDVYELAGGCS